MNFYVVSKRNDSGLVFDDLVGLVMESRPVCEPRAYKSRLANSTENSYYGSSSSKSTSVGKDLSSDES
ncbi:hypothetical protein Sjap_009777 [Stephania japonica]|uniref:Uncharacterized protein n=1 Tax=Stephania japonica TaxID=461633 RepID=A0AAP0J971_9MAGN